MKGFLILIAILALAAGGALSYHRAQRPVPAIGMKIVEENAWSGSTNYLPSVNGYSGTFNSGSSGDGGYQVTASYQVDSSSPGHFFVLAHYKITRNGSSTEVDKALSVLPYYKASPIAKEKLKQTTWTNLDNHLCAFAYMSDNTLYY
jgi:hypothetical protein